MDSALTLPEKRPAAEGLRRGQSERINRGILAVEREGEVSRVCEERDPVLPQHREENLFTRLGYGIILALVHLSHQISTLSTIDTPLTSSPRSNENRNERTYGRHHPPLRPRNLTQLLHMPQRIIAHPKPPPFPKRPIHRPRRLLHLGIQIRHVPMTNIHLPFLCLLAVHHAENQNVPGSPRCSGELFTNFFSSFSSRIKCTQSTWM